MASKRSFPVSARDSAPHVQASLILRVVNAPDPKPGDPPARISGLSIHFGQPPQPFSILCAQIIRALGDFHLDARVISVQEGNEEIQKLIGILERLRITEPELPLEREVNSEQESA